MGNFLEGLEGKKLRTALLGVLVVLGLYLAAQTIGEIWQFRYIGSGMPATNVISVTGEGEAVAVPDRAEFTFSVVEKKDSVRDAQSATAEKINAAIAYLKEAGVDEKDIKTVGYNVYPQYEWQGGVCTSGGICPPGRQVLLGYEVRQTLTIKVRDTEKAGELLSGVGDRGATEMSSLVFTVDDDKKLAEEARSKAIAEAKDKAQELADELGVRLVRVVSFSEFGGGYPMPYYSEAAGFGRGGDVKSTPETPMGENKIVSNVTITYEIR